MPAEFRHLVIINNFLFGTIFSFPSKCAVYRIMLRINILFFIYSTVLYNLVCLSSFNCSYIASNSSKDVCILAQT